MIANVRGHFSDFDGTVEAAEDDPVNSRVWGTVKVASISTGDPQRDEHLKSPDFFDAARYPEITFESTRVRHLDGGTYEVAGDLMIKGVTREVELNATVEGTAVDPWGVEPTVHLGARDDQPQQLRPDVAAEACCRRTPRRRRGPAPGRRLRGPSLTPFDGRRVAGA